MEDQQAARFSKLDNAARYFAGRGPGKTSQPSGDAETTVPGPVPSPGQHLWQQQQWLHQQITEHQGALNAAKHPKPASSNQLEDDIENLQIRTGDLQNELIEARTNASLRDLMIQRNQLSCTLSKIIDDHSPEEEGIRKRVVELLGKQAELGSATLRIQEEIQNLTPQLEEAKNKNLDLLKSNRELMWNLQEATNAAQSTPKKDDKELKRLQAGYDNKVAQIKIMRHILQALILGSGVNWAADDQLRETVIKMGSPLDKQLEKP